MTWKEQTIQRYLLGEMSEPECAALELEYFRDPHLFLKIEQVENELVDNYARGLLPPDTREQFERHYLAHPARRERAAFAEALTEKLEQPGQDAADAPMPRAESFMKSLCAPLRWPRFAWALSAVFLLTVAATAWLYVRTERPQPEMANIEERRALPKEGESQPQVDINQQPTENQPDGLKRPDAGRKGATPAPTPPAKTAPAFASLTLTVGGVRGGDDSPPPVLVVADGTQRVRLQLRLRDNSYTTYNAELRPAGRRAISSWQALTPTSTKSGASLTLTLPAEKLDDGDYILTLSGVEAGTIEEVSKSLFSVRRR